MKLKKKKRFIGALLAVTLLVATPAIVLLNVNAEDEVPPQSYEIVMGEVVSVPTRTLTLNGESKQAEIKIVAPNGGTYTGKSFTVNSAGIWTVEYYADFNGQLVTEKEVYTCTRRSVDMFESNGNVSLTSSTHSLDTSIQGVKATFTSGGELTFSPATNLSAFNKDKVFAEFVVDSNAEGVADISAMTITLSDIYDASNQVTISLADAGAISCDGRGTYVRVGAEGQPLSGINRGQVVTLAGNGTEINHSWRNKTGGDNVQQTLKLYWDNAENALYASKCWHVGEGEKVLVADLDDPLIFPDVQWKGFTTGEVDAKISVSGFTSMTGNVLFRSFAGYEFTQEKYPDTEAPEIQIDYLGESSVPYAEVGSSYGVFPATATDAFDGKLPMQIDVYNVNGDGTRMNVPVVNGKFQVEYIGDYVIRYAATDRTGNTSVEEVKFSSVSSAEPISLEIAKMPSVEVYEKVTLPALDTIERSGGFGEIYLTRKVVSPTGKILEGKDTFIPDELGTWTVSYYAEDYCGNHKKEQHLTFKVTMREKPFFIEETMFPKALVKGFTYTLPIVSAKETVNNTIKDASVDRYADSEKLANGTFTATGESVVLKYVASGTNGSTEIAQTIPVIDGNDGKDQDKYFYGDYTVALNKNEVSLTANGKASAMFTNTLNENGFLLGFKFDEEALGNDVEKFAITLTDSKKAGVSVTAYVEYSADGVLFSLDGISKKELKKESGSYNVAYTNSNRRIKDGSASGTNNFVIEKDDNGNVFNSFTGPVWLTISTEEAKGNALQILSINNHALGYRKNSIEQRVDGIGPEIYYEDVLAVKQAIGTTVTLPAGRAYDVMGQIQSFTLTVSAPDGSKPLDNVSAEEEYSLSLTQYGLYRVTYTAVDSNGNKQERRKLFRVNEMEAPTLSVTESSIKSVYSVGSTITIPNYTVSDNSEEYTLNVMLLMPDNETRLLLWDNGYDEPISYLKAEDETYPSSFKAGDKTFRVEEKGKYTLIFFVYDNYYNTSTVRIQFEVK